MSAGNDGRLLIRVENASLRVMDGSYLGGRKAEIRRIWTNEVIALHKAIHRSANFAAAGAIREVLRNEGLVRRLAAGRGYPEDSCGPRGCRPICRRYS